MYLFRLFSILPLLLLITSAWSQSYNTDVNPNRFDYGKMWTFEYPPLDYFEETYGFRPDEAWLEKAQMGSLRFANWCSASFISPDGLILTNHHCSRDVVLEVQKEGEQFDQNGFYAKTQEEERRASRLFVKQLVKIEDVTDQVLTAMEAADSDEEMQAIMQQTVGGLIQEYGGKSGWTDLEIEPVMYYNGGRFSLYGYKRYDDIRLVLLPELALGFFGGDPDNFTYPRYALDFTLWRAYDENGEPLNTSEHYFKVNPDGVKKGEATFVTGNPGSTERYRTIAQLEYDRDYRYKIELARTRGVLDILWKEYEENADPLLLEQIFNYSNGEKARTGILKGMHDPYLMGRKQVLEDLIREKSGLKGTKEDYWAELEKAYSELGDHVMEISLLSPNPAGSNALILAHYWDRYIKALEAESSSEEDLDVLREQVRAASQDLTSDRQRQLLTALFDQLQEFRSPDDTYLDEFFGQYTPKELANRMLDKTKMDEEKALDKLLAQAPGKLNKGKDPILKMRNILLPEYYEAADIFQSTSPQRRALERKIGRAVYDHYGLDIPPDATFTLRLADGTVDGYKYNGTEAPIYTTFYGMYDRHYSHGQEFPWNLPARWANPPAELLKTPLNFVSTNDIIGGNSGSPMLNQDLELIGLIFDGNIESLPGNFIYESTSNRTVSVHAGAIVGAMRYIFEADRILKELGL